MLPADVLLRDALRDAPRRWRMPPLPADAHAAQALGSDAVLAFAIEAARRAHASAQPPAQELRALFVQALAGLVARSVATVGGDPAFRARVLQTQEPAVGDYLALAADRHADIRHVRSAVDAFAHPAKLQKHAGELPAPLAQLHGLARGGDWAGLRDAMQALVDTEWRSQVAAVLAAPALARLERIAWLGTHASVLRYLALSAEQGPPAGSSEAAAQGRAAAQAGAATEARTLRAFHAIAARLDAAGPGGHRAVQGLRPRSGLPRAAHGAKDEWDAAILRAPDDGGPSRIVLLAEAKASPAAAVSDWPRLVRGLERLAQVPSGMCPVFHCNEGDVRVDAESLRDLAPVAQGLPPHVIYCCAAQEPRAALLAPPARALLLQQPGCIGYACALARGEPSGVDALVPIWGALTRDPRLRAVLEQYDTARRARESMLHPDDLLASLRPA